MGIRKFHYSDFVGFGHDVTYCNDVIDLPHKSACWTIQPTIKGRGLVCISYNTVVANIDYMPDGRAQLYIYGWTISTTTRKHIRWFLDYLGVYLSVDVIKRVNNNPLGYELLPGEYTAY